MDDILSRVRNLKAMHRTKRVPSLYLLSLRATHSLLRRLPVRGDDEWPLDRVPGHVVSDLMEAHVVDNLFVRAYWDAEGSRSLNLEALFAPRVRRGTIFYDPRDFPSLFGRCGRLREITLVQTNEMDSVATFPKIVGLLNRTCVVKVVRFVCYENLTVSSPEVRRVLRDKLLGNYGSYHVSLQDLYDNHLSGKVATVDFRAPSLCTVELHLDHVDLAVADVELILLACPRICILRNTKLLVGLYSLHASRRGPRRYELRNLDLNYYYDRRVLLDEDAVGDAVSTAVRLCPKIFMINVTFDLCGHVPQGNPFASISKLDAVESLSVGGVRLPRSVCDIVEGLLATHGRTLKSLELAGFPEPEAERLVSLCPRLENLKLHVEEGYAERDLDPGGPTTLRYFYGYGLDGTRSPLLRRVLSCRDLRVVFLDRASFPPRLLAKAPWPRLALFAARRCRNLQPRHLERLLKAERPLEELCVERCRGIDEEASRRIQSLLASRRLPTVFKCIVGDGNLD